MYVCTYCTTLNQDSDQTCWTCGVLSCSHCRLTHGSEWLTHTRGLSTLLAFQSSQTRGCLKDLQMELPPIRGDFAPPDWIDVDHFERSLTRTAFDHSNACPGEGCTEYDGHEDKEEGEFQVPTWLSDMALKLVLAEWHRIGDPDFDDEEEDGDEGAQDAVDVWYYFSELEAVDW
ncbi:hypothetical protein CLAFUW4_13531 [Fulvia fulva]|uniref:RanBP2-type domain-containing protein n=1 Tax=Passalora fulva TaxID=5499 RepID=A0A9Q8PKK9_PASFU|nr:uncharacterized protein CLAFUR5_13382 [Fulvia fulva]KAK4610087.1 hypothetical protein CLAFUR4_13533 [Fulvia fulva]KAK4611432.1 hypothetical protein CLAFUR0_13542 [Fulvia fulva]UJO24359.1 hypothetical protein CLAFUR5_13382 [Fulvia fulva]WPV21858.1 hypothetical protein CLAFUW4_13531 [Fulvia fulva]WPV37213.1 hypothetical protein CLAFUW7_13538 [Fulvia fulva]